MKPRLGIPFALFAPRNPWVNLIGEWDGWQPAPMLRDDDGWWRVTVDLPDGEHEYKFETESRSYFAKGEHVTVADPRAEQLSRDVYENAIVRVKDGGCSTAHHEWRHDGVRLEGNESLIIYEMHIGDFRGGSGDEGVGRGTFLAVAERLDHLADLGVNALQIMPVTEFPGEHDWGYMPRSLFAVENSYGDPAELCRLVDECHARGIRVIVDGVYNHADTAHPLARIDHGYWFHDVNPDEPAARFGPKFDFSRFDAEMGLWPAREYVRDAILYWIDRFHIDGIRFDATALIDDYEVLSLFRSVIADRLEGMKPFFAVAEHVPEDPGITGSAGPMDAAWHELFAMQLTSTLAEQVLQERPPSIDALLEVLDPRRQGYESAFNVVNYLGSHDHDRIMWKLGQAGWFDEAAFRRLKLGAAILFGAPGQPMIWMGDELGMSHEKSARARPLEWDLLKNEANADLLEWYRRLISLRRRLPALRGDSFEVVYRDDDRSLLGFKRWDESGDPPGAQVVVLANLRDTSAAEVEVAGWPADGMWREVIHEYVVEVRDGVLRDNLGPSEVKIYEDAETRGS